MAQSETASPKAENPSPKADHGFFTDAKPTEAVKVESVKPIPPKDPETGRFVKTESTPPPVPTHTQEALDAAAYFGIPEDVVKDLAPHKLSSMLIRMQQQQLVQQRQEALQRTFEESQARTAAVPPPPKDIYDEFKDIDLGTEEDGTPTIRTIHPALLKVLKAKLDKQEATIRELKDTEEKRLNTQLDDAVDEAVAELNAKEFYGEGGLRELAQDAPERQRRLKLYRDAEINPNVDSPRKISVKIKKAHEDRLKEISLLAASQKPVAATPGGYEAPTPSQPSEGPRFTPEQFAEGALSGPTSRELEELPNGEEKAIRGLEKALNVPRKTKRSEIMAGFFNG